MPVLNVPFFVQPTPETCQSTCLKMMAAYLDVRSNRPQVFRSVDQIWQAINTGTQRPEQVRNSYENMRWWLAREFPNFHFRVDGTQNERTAITTVIRSLESGFPLMISTNHMRTSGHIILIIGYRVDIRSLMSGMPASANANNTKFICNDPYGKFNPSLQSHQWGTNRWESGMCIPGGHIGPGKSVEYDISGIRRIRSDKHSPNTFYFIYGRNRN